jgi:integrase
MTAHAITYAFIRATKRVGLKDLHFHDLRHEAITRLFEKGFNVMEVGSISGHKTLQMLQRYTHLRAENFLERLG